MVLSEPADLPVGERVPCPACGALTRTVHLEAGDTVGLYSSASVKGRHPGGGKPYVEQKVGDDLHRATGRWNHLSRRVDRENERYDEVVTDPRTGKVVHECHEPLSKHRGHGGAKHRLGGA